MDIGSTVGEAVKNCEMRKHEKRFLFDTMSIKTPKNNMHLQPFLKDCLVEDWNVIEKALYYTFNKHLRCDPSKHPILMSEPVV